jgi:hypothetical protein
LDKANNFNLTFKILKNKNEKDEEDVTSTAQDGTEHNPTLSV